MSRSSNAHVLAWAALCAGCWFGSGTTDFPPGLEPLEDNLAPAQAGPPFVEAMAYLDGDNGRWAWVHGRGYLQAPPSEVWAALKRPEVVLAFCSTDRQEVEADVEPEYEHSFRVHYTVEELISVSWQEAWRYGTIDGVTAAPRFGMVRYQKVYGSNLIRTLEGSIQLHATADAGATELQLIEHVDAAGGTVEDMRRSMQHRFDSVQAVVGGGEPPPCP
jgi:uncharacterized protein YndB with AHSA1/START domain